MSSSRPSRFSARADRLRQLQQIRDLNLYFSGFAGIEPRWPEAIDRVPVLLPSNSNAFQAEVPVYRSIDPEDYENALIREVAVTDREAAALKSVIDQMKHDRRASFIRRQNTRRRATVGPSKTTLRKPTSRQSLPRLSVPAAVKLVPVAELVPVPARVPEYEDRISEYRDLPLTLRILKAADDKYRRERSWRNLEAQSDSDSNAPVEEDLIKFDEDDEDLIQFD